MIGVAPCAIATLRPKFLDAAVEAGSEWAHLDIAGTYWSDRDRAQAPKGPQGPAVRTLIALADRFAT